MGFRDFQVTTRRNINKISMCLGELEDQGVSEDWLMFFHACFILSDFLKSWAHINWIKNHFIWKSKREWLERELLQAMSIIDLETEVVGGEAFTLRCGGFFIHMKLFIAPSDWERNVIMPF